MSFSIDIVNQCAQCGHGEVLWEWDGMTYNLAPMFRKAGFYCALQRDGARAGSITELVRQGLKDMLDNPGGYRALNPPNGWGDYEGAVQFTTSLVAACEKFPDGTLRGSW